MPINIRRPTSRSNNYLMSVKKFALIICLLACFFLAGILLGCYIGYGYRLLDKQSALEESQRVKVGCFFHENFQDHHKVTDEFLDSFGAHVASGNISEEYLREIFMSTDKTKQFLMAELNLTQLNSFATYTYNTKIPKYYPANRNFISFYLPDLSVIEEELDHLSFFYSPGGIFEGDAVLLDEKDEGFDSIDFELIKGNVMIVPYDFFHLAKIRALEHLRVEAVLFYNKIELTDCNSNALKYFQRSSVYSGDPFTPGYSAIGGIHNILENITTAFRIPVGFMSCETAWQILPHLRKGSLNYSKVSVHLEFSKELQFQKVSNFILPFHGGKEPKISVVIGSNRKGQKGTERLMKLMKSLSLVLHDDWIPRRTIKFISWDSQKLGISEFIETFKFVWNEKVIAYIDLDDYSSLDDKFYFLTSSSLKELLDGIIQKKNSTKSSLLRVKVKTDKTVRETGGGELFEQEMGIPYVGIAGKTVESEESKILKILASVMLLLVNDEVLQIFPEKTYADLFQSIQDLQITFPFVTKKIPALPKLSYKLSTGMKKFDKFIRKNLGRESGKGKEILNDMILKVESQQRVILHKLWKLNKKPPFELLHKLNVSCEYCQFSDIFEMSYSQPSDCKSAFEVFLLREVSVIVSKLQGILEVLNYTD